MEPLSAHDLTRLLGFLRAIYQLCDLTGFRSTVLQEFANLIALEFTGYTEIDVRNMTHSFSLTNPSVDEIYPEGPAAFARHLREHPLISHYARTRSDEAMKISDFLERKAFHDLGIYQEFFRPVGIENQMAVTLNTNASTVIGITVNRSTDFNERERTLLNTIRPHLLQAYANATAISALTGELAAVKATLARTSAAVVLLGEGHQVKFVSPLAERLLEHYFDRRNRASGLPGELRQWIRTQGAALADFKVPLPLVVGGPGRRLIVRFSSDREHPSLLLEEEITHAPRHALQRLGLTAREAEVLSWVATGKSNLEVAAIIGVNGRTVEKHLQNIFRKLGVESRTAAAARAWEAVGAEPTH